MIFTTLSTTIVVISVTIVGVVIASTVAPIVAIIVTPVLVVSLLVGIGFTSPFWSCRIEDLSLVNYEGIEPFPR